MTRAEIEALSTDELVALRRAYSLRSEAGLCDVERVERATINATLNRRAVGFPPATKREW